MSPAPAQYVVREPTQIAALTGPLPQRMIGALERLGPSTVNDLAAAIGVEAESLYYHVRRFVRVGLLLEVQSENAAGRETTFALPGRELVLDHRSTGGAFLSALAKATSSVLRMVDRQASTALASPRTRRGGRRRNFMVQQHFVRLSPDDLAELNDRFEAIARFIAERDDPYRADWQAVTMVMTPFDSKPGEES